MWIVEWNVLGRRFTHEVRRPGADALSPRKMSGRVTQLLRARAAA